MSNLDFPKLQQNQVGLSLIPLDNDLPDRKVVSISSITVINNKGVPKTISSRK